MSSEKKDRLEELDGKFEEVLAAGPVAPGPVEGLTEIAHKTTELAERVVDKVRGGRREHPAEDDPADGQDEV